MRDDYTIPNLGDVPDTYSGSFFNRMYRNIEMVLKTMQNQGPIQVSTLALYPVTVDGLAKWKKPQPGFVSFASNGRKAGQGAGAGTGVLVFYDGTNWIACDSGQPVSD